MGPTGITREAFGKDCPRASPRASQYRGLRGDTYPRILPLNTVRHSIRRHGRDLLAVALALGLPEWSTICSGHNSLSARHDHPGRSEGRNLLWQRKASLPALFLRFQGFQPPVAPRLGLGSFILPLYAPFPAALPILPRMEPKPGEKSPSGSWQTDGRSRNPTLEKEDGLLEPLP